MIFSILHLTDLHFDSKDIDFIIDLRDRIIKNLNNKKVDMIVFSGDLVQKPSFDNLEKAYKTFLLPIMESCSLDNSSCFFTTGNHEINMTERDKLLFSGLKEYVIEKEDKQTIDSLIEERRILNEISEYKKFIDTYNVSSSLIKNNQLFTIYTKKIENIQIGIVSINSSMFMEGSSIDYGNLFIPESILLKAAQEIKDSTIKVINIHHSFNWYKNKKEIEKILLDKFNLVFFGHEHEHDGKYILDLQNRDILTLHGTSIHHKKNDLNGYCLYTYDTDALEMNILNSIYNKRQRDFQDIKTQLIEIDLTSKSNKTIRNQTICSKLYPNILNKINKYLSINLTSEVNQRNIEEIFVNQKIVELKEESTSRKFSKKNENEKSYLINELIEDNSHLLLTGKTESGKTTILNIMNLTYLKEYNDLIPIFLFSAEFMGETSERIIISKIGEYLDKHYGKNKFKINNMLNEKRFVLLIDDIHLLNNTLVNNILNLNNKIVATYTSDFNSKIENVLEQFSEKSDIYNKFKKLEIKSLRKKDCNLLVKNIVPEDKSNKIANKVQKSLSTLRLPSNPLIATLLTWMHVERINIKESEPEIIDVFLDYLLEKTDMSKKFEGKIDFQDKKDLLAIIAFEFFKVKSFAIKEDDILIKLIEHMKYSAGEDFGAKDILEYFYQRRILLKNNNKVIFSYRVFYYYFISLYMKNTSEFRNHVLNDKNLIINMPDELRYYSVMSRHDTDFLNTIFTYLDNSFFNKKIESQKIEPLKVKSPSTNTITAVDSLDKSLTINEHEMTCELKLSKEELELQHDIDDSLSEARDSNIQNYNYEIKDNLNLIELKKYREEYFVLTIVASEFLKHLDSSISFEDKYTYLNRLLSNYSVSMEYWKSVLMNDNLIKKFVSLKAHKDIKDIDNKELFIFRDFLNGHVMTMITEIVEGSLSTAKLENCYEKIINSTGTINKYFFLLIMLTEIEAKKSMKYIENFISINNDNTLFKILASKLTYDYVKQNYSSEIKKEIYQILLNLDMILRFDKSVIKDGKLRKLYMPDSKKNIDSQVKLCQVLT